MHSYSRYFPVRGPHDALDVAPLLFDGLRHGGERILMTFEQQPLSAARMAARVATYQRWLAAQGVTHGDRVALMLGNGLEHIALIYALMLSGIAWVPVNTRLKGPGLSYLIGHACPKLLITQDTFREAVQACATEIDSRCRTVWVDTLPPITDGDGDDDAGALTCAPVTPSDTLCIIYTSGTTGAPKGVVFTHRMMRIASEATMIVADAHDGDCLFVWEPLCHIGGAQMLLTPFLARLTLAVAERFSASRFWPEVVAANATQLHYLGGILDILMQMPPQAQPAHHPIRVAWGAGVSAQAWGPIRERLKLVLRECYGMTECSSFATVNDDGTPGSIGRPLPWLTLELLDDADQPVPPGEPGQIVLSSDVEGVFLDAYLDNPQASASAMRGGKLHTGDMARADANGNLFFIGRRTDSMRVRGENVSAWEIERVFALHPAVAASAAIGVTSDIGEQDILLYVQFKPEQPVDFTELAQWAQDKLAAFQQPRYYARVEQFETTPSERIRKHLLPRTLDGAWDRRAG